MRTGIARRCCTGTVSAMSGDAGRSRARSGSGLFEALHPGGVRQSSITLIQTALGAGFLTLSYAMSLSGLGLGLVLLAIDGLVTYLGIEILMRGAILFEARDTATLLSKCIGSWCVAALDALLTFYGCGSIIAYFILCGDFIPGILNDMVALQWMQPLGYTPDQLRSRCILGSLLLVVPLSIPMTLGALRYATPISLIAVFGTAVTIMWNCPANFEEHFDTPDYGTINWLTVDINIFKSFSICLFAFNCHMNIVPVASELQRTSSRNIATIAGGVMLILVFFYGSIGAGGYLSFLSQTKQNVTQNYSLSVAVTLCRVLLCCSLVVAIPTNLTPTVRSFQGALRGCFPSLVGGSGLQEPMLEGSSSSNDAGRTFTLASKAVCLFIQVSVALAVTNVADVMGFLGATVGTLLMMGIPLAVLFKARFEDYSSMKFGVAVLVLSGTTMVSMSAIVVLILQKSGYLPDAA